MYFIPGVIFFNTLGALRALWQKEHDLLVASAAYIRACLRASMRACVRARAFLRAHACVRACVCVCVCVCAYR